MSTNTYLIGTELKELPRFELPTNRNVLRYYAYKQRISPRTAVHKIATAIVDDVYNLWSKINVPLCEKKHCIIRFEKLYRRWKILQRNKRRITSLTQQTNEYKFKECLVGFFNIKRQNADISMEKLAELMNAACQSEKRNQEAISRCSGSSQPPKQKEIDTMDKLTQETSELVVSQPPGSDDNPGSDSVSQLLQQPSEAKSDKLVADSGEPGSSQASHLSHSNTSETLTQTSSNYSDRLSNYQLSKRPKLDIVTEKMALTLDKTQTSSRDAAHILAAAAVSCGYELHEVNLSHSTIHRTRINVRRKLAARLKENLRVADHLTLHWDGKLLPESGTLKKVERIPVIVSGLGTEQLLGVPKFDKGSAVNEAQGIAETIHEWNLGDQIKAMCFDTTPLNTGHKGGVCVLLEQKLGKKLLHFACRHHVYELMLRAVVEIYWPETNGPDMPTFKRFQRKWEKIDQANYDVGLKDQLIHEELKNEKNEILDFVQLRLKETQPRDDYKEFLQLSCIFLGGVPPKGIVFKAPGAVHHARWMAKAIYSLKIFLFKKQFDLKKAEIDGLRQICIFIIRFYIKSWFDAPNAIKAPNQDLTLLQNLIKYRKINAAISKAASRKLRTHLWYISEHLAPLAFFDETVSDEIKSKMVHAIREREGARIAQTRVVIEEADFEAVVHKDVSDFITKRSLFLFDQYDLPHDFLDVNPESWKTEASFIKCKEILEGLKVVNDTAERAVALAQDFNLLLTKDEDQRQYLLQVVKFHIEQYPTCQKKALASLLPTNIDD